MKEISGHFHHPETGEHLGFIWPDYSIRGRVQWFCEDMAGEKRPGPLPSREACETWLMDRRDRSRAA